MIPPRIACNWPAYAGLAVILFFFFPAPPFEAGPVSQDVFAQRVLASYQRSKTQFASTTNLSPIAWEFARACYDLADFATNDDRRADLAREGMDACRKLISVQPNSGPAHYYLGMNEGQLARTELVGALFLVRDMEREFKTAWTLDPRVDHGGPARSLGMLYRDAPGWPTSIGSRSKSKEWFEKSEKLEPGFPENPMVLAESGIKWDDWDGAKKYLNAVNAIWPQAQTNFTGVTWERDWADWSSRRDDLKRQVRSRDERL